MITGVVNTDILGTSSSMFKVKKSFADTNQTPLFSMKNGGTGFESQFATASSSFERAQSVASSRSERTSNSLMKFAKQESDVNNLFRNIKAGQAKIEDLENCIKSAESGKYIGAPQTAEMANAKPIDIDEKLSDSKNISSASQKQNIDKSLNVEVQQIQQNVTQAATTTSGAPVQAKDLTKSTTTSENPTQSTTTPAVAEQQIAQQVNQAATKAECEKQKVNTENVKYNNEMADYSQKADQKKAEYQATIKDALAMLKADYAYEKAQLTVNEDQHSKKSEKTADIKKDFMINNLSSSQANTQVKSAETRMVSISSLAQKEAEGSKESPKADAKQSATPVETGSTDKDQKGKNPFGVTV